MRARRERRRLVLLAATGLAAAALGILAWATDAFSTIEARTIDARFDVRGKEKPNRDVVVVGIDDQTLQDLNVNTPFPRSLHERVIDRLKRDGAKVIAYDLQFTQPTKVDEDNALIEAIGRAGNVVLATAQVADGGRTDVLGSDRTVRRVRARVGSIQLPTVADKVYRFHDEDRGVPSFPVAIAERSGRTV